MAQLTEPTAVALAQQIRQVAMVTPTGEIATSYVHRAPDRPSPDDLPILLLHGFDSSVLEFRRLLPLLGQACDTWAVDLLGFGFTERRSQGEFTPIAIKNHLYAVWQTLIGRPMVLVGASMGGAAAIDFALTYPAAVAKLVLVDSAGYTTMPAMGKFLVPPLGDWATAFLRQPQVRQQVSRKAYFDPKLATPDAALCAALHLQMPNWSEALIAFTRSSGYGFLGREKVAKITRPTLILWGAGDRILGTADAMGFQGAIAHSTLEWIADCGHVPHLEKPEITAQHINHFAAL